jgi:hypothetical protein
MYAVVGKLGLVAKDFRTRPEALSWIKQYDTPMRIIRQDSKEFLRYEGYQR